MESCSQGGAPMTAQTLGLSIAVDNQESGGTITIPTEELLNLYRLLAKKDSKIEEQVDLLNEKENRIKSIDADICKKDKIIFELKEEIKKLKEQHNTDPFDKTSGFNRDKIITLLSCKDAEKCADILIEEILPYKDKGNPKKGLFPLFCAIKNGWLERPSYKDFNEAFPGVCTTDASYSQYIPDDRESKYETNPSKSFDIEAHCDNMQIKLSNLVNYIA